MKSTAILSLLVALCYFIKSDAFVSWVPQKNVGILYSSDPFSPGYRVTIYGEGTPVYTGAFGSLKTTQVTPQSDTFEVNSHDSTGSPIVAKVQILHSFENPTYAANALKKYGDGDSYEDPLIKSYLNQLSNDFSSTRTYGEWINQLSNYTSYLEDKLQDVQNNHETGKTGINILSVVVVSYKLSEHIETSRKEIAKLNAEISLIQQQKVKADEEAQLAHKIQINKHNVELREVEHTRKLAELDALGKVEAQLIFVKGKAEEDKISAEREHETSLLRAESNEKLLTDQYIELNTHKSLTSYVKNLWDRFKGKQNSQFIKDKLSKVSSKYPEFNKIFQHSDFEKILSEFVA
jgi:hypothetical protein